MARRAIQAVCLGLLVGSTVIAIASAAGSQPPAPDITSTHGLENAGLCSFASGGERLFSGLEKLRYKQSLHVSREVGGVRLSLDGRRTSRLAAGGGSNETGLTVGVPVRPIRWHGLPVRAFAVGYNRPPESDSLYWREVRLSASSAQVRTLLGRSGVRVPPGGYHRIKDDHPCGGALTLKSKTGETSIRCEWGC